MPWHTEPNADLESRRQMITLIANFLEKAHGKPPEQQDAVVATARKLEVALYKASKCKQEYMETRSLSCRIRELERSGNFNVEPAIITTASSSSAPSVSTSSVSTSSNAQQSVVSGSANSASAQTGPATSTVGPAASSVTSTTIPSAASTASAPITHAPATATTVSSSAAPSSSEVSKTAIPSSTALTLTGNGNRAASTGPVGNSAANATAHAEVLKQRRTRLLLLKHASRCTDPQCPHHWCPQMKRLWQHVAQCKAPECTVPHCVSSHYVLSHYHRCKDKECPVCKPVREDSQRRREAAALAAAQNSSANALQRPASRNGSSSGALALRDGSAAEVQAHNRRLAETSLNASNAIDPRFARGARDGTGPSLPLSMSRKAVEQHLDSIRVEHMQQMLFPLLRKLMENTKFNAGHFNEPVDPVRDNVPTYYDVVLKPMDFGTIRRRLEDGRYRKVGEFEADVRQVFENATLFNPRGHYIHENSIQLKNLFEVELKKIKQKLSEPTVPRRSGQCPLCKQFDCTKCILCDRGCMAYEPKILFCAGTCQGRIARNATFYSLPGSALSWCSECHDKKKDGFITDNSTGTQYKKTDLIKRKHDELIGEPWVGCDVCSQWAHQTCALFNSRKQNPQNKLDKYVCPKCLVKSEIPTATKVPVAEDLEHTRLSKFLEMWVRSKLGDALVKEKLNPPKIRGDDPPPAEAVTIRVLSNHDETFQTKPFARAVGSAPESLTYRSRAIFLFQHLDGVDVLLFVMYVQEYGSDAPPPNRGKVYIAYLDSVHFFRPRHYRTLVYHELLLAYLEYARRQGFTSCYIWACPPPNKKDDYILHCHPEDQRVPSHERLRMWYHEMIKRGAAERIVLSSCSLFEEHYEFSTKKAATANKKKDQKAKSQLSKANMSKSERALQKSTSMALEDKSFQQQQAESLAGTMFDEDADDALDDINFEDMGNPTPSMTPGPNCMAVSGSMMTPMRRASSSPVDDAPLFLGLRKPDLDTFSEEEMERRRSHKLATRYQMPMFDGDYWPNEFEDVSIDIAKRNRASGVAVPGGDDARKGGRKASGGSDALTVQNLATTGELGKIEGKAVMTRIGEYLESMKADFLVVKLAHECSCCGEYLLRGRWECRHPDCLQAAGFNRPTPFSLCEECFLYEIKKSPEHQHGGEAQLSRPSTTIVATPSHSVPPIVENGDSTVPAGGEPEGRKIPEDDETAGGSESDEKGSKKESEQWDKQPLGCTRLVPEPCAQPSHQLCFVDERLPLKTPRSDKTFRNHLLDTRHAFLSLCTGNRYAFNQLRRAKHSTMMILYHLHNPDAPAHLHICNICSEDIISGYRYNCAICSGGDYDLCTNCFRSNQHEHKLTAIEVTRTVDQDMSESVRKKGVEQRRARQRSLQVFLAALVHSSSCQSEDCNEVACTKMKELLLHRQSCKIRVRGGCEICRRVLCLVQMHARGTEHAPACTKENCPVPHCDDLKKHLKQKEETAAAAAGVSLAKLGGADGKSSAAQAKTKDGKSRAAGVAVATGANTKKKQKAEGDGDGAPANRKKRPLGAMNGAITGPADEGGETGPKPALKIKIKVGGSELPKVPAIAVPGGDGDGGANTKRARVSTPKVEGAKKI